MTFPRRKSARSGCLKTDECARGKKKYHWAWWLFPVVGLLSLIWFVLRVVPKPSRAAYPCQRVAAPLAGGFVLWLVGVIASAFAYRKTRELFRQSRLALACVCLVVTAAMVVVALVNMPERPALADPPNPNNPVGEAKGTNPGRVVWVHDEDSTSWTSGIGHWWQSAYTDQTVVDAMMERAVCGLVGTPNISEAWTQVFKHYNLTHGKGDVGYTAGEKIAIKVNFVGTHQQWTDNYPYSGCPDWGNCNPTTHNLEGQGDDYMNTSPQMMLALLRQLIYQAGVPEANISIGDPTCFFANPYYDALNNEFPGVHYMEFAYGAYGGTQGREAVEMADGLSGRPYVPFYWSCHPTGVSQDYVPVYYAEADYFINLANLKSHTSNGGITVCGKNHFGSLKRIPVQGMWGGPDHYDMHLTLPADRSGYGYYRCMVDLMGHAHTGGKLLLCLIDGLYAGRHPADSAPTKWDTCPPYDDIGSDWTSCLLASQDPVAIDSVAFDLLYAEWPDADGPAMSGTTDYLTEAALADGPPPSGTFYDPDHSGNVTRLPSLGTHEHWNNENDKRYSRNLGYEDGIELAALTTQEMLNVRPVVGNIIIDGDPSDWNLGEFGTLSVGGEGEIGDIGAVGWIHEAGYDAFYCGCISDRVEWGFTYTYPDDATDHAVRFYSRHDASYQYFLVRCDDDIIWTSKSYNFENDCAEFFVDPGRYRSTTEIWGSSASSGPFELVIDAKNEQSVAETSSTYRSQILGGVTSAVSTDATGWWLEFKIAKNVTAPPLPASGTFGLNINFRDQDADFGNEHLYGWTDDYQVPSPPHFPDKVPYNWGNVYNGYELSEDPPVIAEVTPDPDSVVEYEAYTKQLTLLEGTPPVTWSVVQWPGGLEVDQSGYVSGWTPDENDIGSFTTIEIQAQNAFGVDTETWQVCVQSECVYCDFDGDGDVDMSDFGHYQACLTGPGLTQDDPACQDADLDGDGDVDYFDFSLFFEACLGGANIPASPPCQ